MDKKKTIASINIPLVDWETLRKHETRLLRALTIRESIQQYREMQVTFEWQMQQTAELFGQNHRQALVELQARLKKLAHWQT